MCLIQFCLCSSLTVGSADGRLAENARSCRFSQKTSRQTEDKRERLRKLKIIKNGQLLIFKPPHFVNVLSLGGGHYPFFIPDDSAEL